MEINRTYLRELSCISKLSGQDERLVQASGGNTSVKVDERLMLVKASGFSLTDITEEQGYALVDYGRICEAFQSREIGDEEEEALLSSAHLDGKRPSIETFLHSFTQKYTIHTHPLGVTMLASRKNGMARLRELFPDAMITEYFTPGIRLAREFYSHLRESDSQVTFFKNHGLMVSAAGMEEVIRLQRHVIEKVDSSLGLDISVYGIGNALFDALQKVQPGSIAYRVEAPDVTAAIERSGGVWDHAYTPDCVVYCGNRIAEIESDYEESLKRFKEQFGIIRSVFANGHLYAVAENMKKAKETACMLVFSAKIYNGSPEGQMETLDWKERDYLLGWDSEKYRASL